MLITNRQLDSMQKFRGADKPWFWYHCLVFAYQPNIKSDKDPNTESELEGFTSSPLHRNLISVVYVESVREAVTPGEVSPLRVESSAYYKELHKVIAHEIGHAPGRRYSFLKDFPDYDWISDPNHKEGGIMSIGAAAPDGPDGFPEFSPKTINRFRAIKSWQTKLFN